MNKDFTNAAVPRLKDQPEFIAYAQANQWAARRERGWAWQTNVFDFIATTYKDYLGKGLLQSDFRACDPDLYARLHKELTSMPPESSAAKIKELNLPKERSDDALKMLVTDPIERAEISAVRRHERVRSQKYRDGVKNRDRQNIDKNFQNAADTHEPEATPILRMKELFGELSAIYTAASASEKTAFEQCLKDLNQNVFGLEHPDIKSAIAKSAADYMRQRRGAMTPEQRKIQRDKDAAAARSRRANLSPEEIKKLRERDAARMRNKRARAKPTLDND